MLVRNAARRAYLRWCREPTAARAAVERGCCGEPSGQQGVGQRYAAARHNERDRVIDTALKIT
eukprot:365492-Chlamydomonas_euryale.AAC.8